MDNVEKGKKFSQKISYLTLIYVGALDFHIVWAVLFISGYSTKGTYSISIPFYYVPQVIVCLTAIWFINPYKHHWRKTGSLPRSGSSKPDVIITTFSGSSTDDSSPENAYATTSAADTSAIVVVVVAAAAAPSAVDTTTVAIADNNTTAVVADDTSTSSIVQDFDT